MIFCAIWYHLYNFKNMKNTHGGVLLLVKLHTQTLLKVTLHHECFSHFLNCTNGTKSCKTSHMWLLFIKKFLFEPIGYFGPASKHPQNARSKDSFKFLHNEKGKQIKLMVFPKKILQG